MLYNTRAYTYNGSMAIQRHSDRKSNLLTYTKAPQYTPTFMKKADVSKMSII